MCLGFSLLYFEKEFTEHFTIFSSYPFIKGVGYAKCLMDMPNEKKPYLFKSRPETIVVQLSPREDELIACFESESKISDTNL